MKRIRIYLMACSLIVLIQPLKVRDEGVKAKNGICRMFVPSLATLARSNGGMQPVADIRFAIYPPAETFT